MGCSRNNNILLQSSGIFFPPINDFNYAIKYIQGSFTSLSGMFTNAFDIWRVVLI